MNLFFRLAAVGSVALLGAASARAQQNNRFTVSGYVRDGATGESLPGVAVVHPASGQGTTFDFYSLTLASNVRFGYGLFGGAADITYRIQLP